MHYEAFLFRKPLSRFWWNAATVSNTNVIGCMFFYFKIKNESFTTIYLKGYEFC